MQNLFRSRYLSQVLAGQGAVLVLLAAIVFTAIPAQPQASRAKGAKGSTASKAPGPKLTAKSTARPTAKSTARPTAKPTVRIGSARSTVGTQRRTGIAPGSAARKTTVASRYRRQRQVWHPAQAVPSAERYKEIQQALADRGYFQGTPDGQWGADSVDSLKRFQADQHIDVDGKISALSLMGLGLGPKRDTAALVGATPVSGQPVLPETVAPEPPPAPQP